MKTQLLKVYAEVYELDGPRGGWLCKTRGGKWVVLDAQGVERT